ncbi:DUF6079 family protein [Myroides odoratus]|uniref:DUF6079 family protein n=1 Tax=Myroides odoratus TaxID=256 RepID=UPI0033409F1E
MKYNELISFEPITEVVKFNRTNESAYQQNLIKTFVFSSTFKDILIPLMVRNLDLEYTEESFGLQVVGNYGTGKSHTMSLVSLIAEDKSLLELVQDHKAKEELKKIAGKFNVLRFELGHTISLWEIVTFKLEEYLESIGVTFSFDSLGAKSFLEKLQLMMAEYEEKYPDKGLLIVIDEMLAYLKGRSGSQDLNQDLAVLQALGQACDKSKFKFLFGVQEMIYHSPEFQFQSEMLQKVNDRYKDILITKDDVSFIVKNRLLRKDEHQKQKIKDHLDKFLPFFTDMHARTEHYIDLFPVHPSYFENFEKIRIGKSQREILKTLSNQFKDLLDKEIPIDNPGLLTYDQYWKDISNDQSMMSEPDIRKVKEVTDTIYDKIETYFTGGRSSKKDIATRITNACAIKIIQHELQKQNGTNTELLVDDLCLTDKNAFDRDFLIDVIDSAANQIITATSGQYFDKNTDNEEFHLRIEGGINFDQKIKDYAAIMSDNQKDEYFFKFLEINLPLDYDTYRTGFRIWSHAIEWLSHKFYREGYIFFGNPNEKSTTHPRQHFYMYFMPIFDETNKIKNNEEDEIYFTFDNISKEFKDCITLYGAALALERSADSSQKIIYRQKIDELNKKARDIFNQEFVQITQVEYQGKELPLSGYPLPGQGASKEQIFSTVASLVFEPWFNEERPNFPNFNQLNTSITKDNYDKLIRQALTKITNPEPLNRDGEGVLAGLGLWVPGRLDYSHSPYAKSILKLLKDKGDNKVVNRDEIIDFVDKSVNLWLSKDFKIEAELEFIVLATLAALGELEITFPSGKVINSTNLNELKVLQKEDFWNFTHVKRPKGLNLAAIKEMFIGIVGRDLSAHLGDSSTYTYLVQEANELARKTAYIESKIRNGFIFRGIEIISIDQASKYHQNFTAFKGFCDKLTTYTSEAKMKNFAFSTEDITRLIPIKGKVIEVQKLLNQINDLDQEVSYIQQAKQYITSDDLKTEVNELLNQLAQVVPKKDKDALAQYKQELSGLKEKYANWYLKEYLKCRISQREHTEKTTILDSDEHIIIQILKEADYISSSQYYKWVDKINKLQVADNKVNKDALLNSPFHDFNPHDYVHLQETSVKELKQELMDILEQWSQTLLEILEDPMVKKKMSLLNDTEQEILNQFKSKSGKLTKSNALSIRSTITNLHKGLEKVEIGYDELKSLFTKPLTPDEAIEKFKAYIDDLAKGKERDKIRIIIK